MPMGTVAPVWRQQFCDPAGHPYANGTIEVFVAGTSTRAVVYQDQTVTVPHPWPIPLNAGGMTSEALFLLPGAYHFFVKDASGTVQWDDDLVSSVPSSSLDVDSPATFGEAVTYGTAVYESTGLGGKTAGLWYKTSATNDWSSSAAIVVGLATADYAAGAVGFVRLVGRMTKLSGLVVGSIYYAATAPGAITNVRPATNVLQIGIPDSTSSILLAIVVAGQFQTWTPSGGVATIAGEVHIGGPTTIAGTLAVSGATSVAALTATGLTVNGLTSLVGNTGVTGGLVVTGTARAALLQVGGATAGFPAWRNTAARMEAVLADQSNWASVAANNFTSMAAGNQFVDLTVSGATNFAGGVSGTNVNASGTITSTGVVYPGRVDVAGQQTFAYLGSHAAYGLYCNAGLFLAGGLWINGVPFAPGGPSSIRFNVRAANSAVTAAPGDFILIDSGSFTVTLPAVTQGAIIDIKMYGAGPVTVAAPGGVYLDYPASTYVLSVPNQSVTVVGANGNWWVR